VKKVYSQLKYNDFQEEKSRALKPLPARYSRGYCVKKGQRTPPGDTKKWVFTGRMEEIRL